MTTEHVEGPQAERPASPAAEGPAGEQVEYTTGTLRLVAVAALVVGVGVMAGWSWVIVILGLLLMIFLHELGHYVTARLTGMKATEFFLGFGPKIWSFTRGETEYGLKVVPLGAYVRIIGMNNLDEVPPDDESRTYRQQTFPRRLLVVSAGSLMHLAQAFVLAFLLLVVVGTPGGGLWPGQVGTDDDDWVVSGVTEGTAAEAAGIERGDKIVAWDGEPISTFEDIHDSVAASEVGDTVELTVERGGDAFTVQTELGDRRDADLAGEPPSVPTPFLGVGPGHRQETLGLLDGSVQAAADTGEGLWVSAHALGDFFTPSGLGSFMESAVNGGSEEPAGETGGGGDGGSSGESSGDAGRMMSIVGATQIGAELTEDGAAGLLGFFFLINIFIGLVNMAPLLPLDGGHAVVAIYERLRSRKGVQYRVDAAKLMPMVYAVVMVLLFLGLTAVYLDIVDPVRL